MRASTSGLAVTRAPTLEAVAHSPILIVGAGAAGIAAAHALAMDGRDVTVVEARGRIGGRVWTVREHGSPHPLELGAEFVHGAPPATWNAIRDAGIATIEVPFDHWWRRGRRLREVERYVERMREALQGASTLRKDVTLERYLARRPTPPGDRAARRMAREFVEGFGAADPARISARAAAGEIESLSANGAPPLNARLPAGYDALLRHLLRAPSSPRIRVITNCVVREVEWSRHRVVVRARASSGRLVTSGGARLVVTLPLGVLALAPDAEGAVRFVPEIGTKRRALTRLGSGPVVKALLRFRAPFWEGDAFAARAGAARPIERASFLHDPTADFPTWWTQRPLRTTLWTGWAAGPKAIALEGMPKSAVVDAAVRSLARILRCRAATIRDALVSAHAHDWRADPFARGAYSYECVGGHRARRELAAAVDDTLFFAGEATWRGGDAGTVAGALESGFRAARQVEESLDRGRVRRKGRAPRGRGR